MGSTIEFAGDGIAIQSGPAVTNLAVEWAPTQDQAHRSFRVITSDGGIGPTVAIDGVGPERRMTWMIGGSQSVVQLRSLP